MPPGRRRTATSRSRLVLARVCDERFRSTLALRCCCGRIVVSAQGPRASRLRKLSLSAQSSCLQRPDRLACASLDEYTSRDKASRWLGTVFISNARSAFCSWHLLRDAFSAGAVDRRATRSTTAVPRAQGPLNHNHTTPARNYYTAAHLTVLCTLLPLSLPRLHHAACCLLWPASVAIVAPVLVSDHSLHHLPCGGDWQISKVFPAYSLRNLNVRRVIG